MLKKTITLLAIVMCSLSVYSQESAPVVEKLIPTFSRLVASPHINVILIKGDQESVKLVCHHIDPEKVNVEVKRKTLQLYIEDSRYTEKKIRRSRHEKHSAYPDASITAYVTYRKLEYLEIRGEQELSCESPIVAEKFTLKAYGRNEVDLSSLKTSYLKTRLFGENSVRIRSGKAEYQKFRLYGENKINTEELKCFYASATIFGESKLRLSTQDELKVSSFGEARVTYSGEPNVNRGLIFGKTEIRKIEPMAMAGDDQ